MYSRIKHNNLSVDNNNENFHIKVNTTKNVKKLNNFVNSEKYFTDQKESTSSRKMLESASLSITQIETEKEYSRKNVGGKGATLYRMQQAGMQVPEFVTINVNSINNLEHHSLTIESLKPFINDIESFNLPEVSIYSVWTEIKYFSMKLGYTGLILK
jgi:hypothetical protein